jgi:hypothetical protein
MDIINFSSCQTCQYFHGRDGLVCAVNPYGWEQDFCPYWQAKTFTQEVCSDCDESWGVVLAELIVFVVKLGLTIAWAGSIVLSIAAQQYCEKQLDDKFFPSSQGLLPPETQQTLHQGFYSVALFASVSAIGILTCGGMPFIFILWDD